MASTGTGATNAQGEVTSQLTALYQIDIVPYITGISTGLDGAYRSKTSVFNRSALGTYPVRRGETITVKGFNLKNGNSAPTVKIGETTATLTTTQSNAATSSSFEVAIPNTNTTKAKSGDLDVTVNSVVTLNNKTLKTVEYNQEPNGINNDILTDARKLTVWSFSNIVNDTTVRYPTMRVGKDTNQTVGFVYDSGATDVMMYQEGNKFLIDKSFTQWFDTAVAVDQQGRMYGGSMNGDSGSKGNQSMVSGVNPGYGNYGFYAWNSKDYAGQITVRPDSGEQDEYLTNPGHGRQVYSSGTKKVCIENAYNGSLFNANRVKNQKIVATSATTANATGYVYTVYYDSSYDQVRFRYGTVSGTTNSNNQLTFGGGLTNHGNTNNGSGTGYQVIAGTGARGTNTIDGGTAVDNTSRAGEYVAVGVIPKAKITNATEDAAVVAWYDATNTRLLYSYNTTPSVLYTTNTWRNVKNEENANTIYYTNTSLTTHPTNYTGNNATVYKPNNQWGENTKIIDSDFAGWYVDMVVDPDGGIHIAYYGASDGDLKYAYLPSYNADPQVCKVDSYLSVGTNISIEVPTAKETVYKADGTTTTRYVPRISYFMSAFTKTKYSIRTASLYKLGANDVIADGVNNDKFTGNWEVMTIPTEQIPLDYTIGVGLKKNESNTDSTLLGYGTKSGLQTAALQ